MIILDKYPIKIFKKNKNNNLYIYNYDRPFKGETTKIIIKKNKFLSRQDEDEDYWEFTINKIAKLSSDWKLLSTYLKKNKFDFTKKVKIFSKVKKLNLKVELFKKNICFIYYNHKYNPINLQMLREYQKLYKKFVNRFCYSYNYDHPDIQKYADNIQSNLWFQWFYINYPEYHLPFEERKKNDIILGGCYIKDNLTSEPKIDYDLFNLFW